MPENIENRAYGLISKDIDEWLEVHKGETFDLDLVCRQLNIVHSQSRKYASVKLNNEVAAGVLEKSNKVYRYIVRTIKTIDWINNANSTILPIVWPFGHEDDSHFGFDGHAEVSPGDVIVVAGVTNTGKSTFAMDLLWLNMDSFPCTLMVNEYSPGKFKRRVDRMTWGSALKEDGTSKFELIERYDSWQDIIRPDNINIIDWVNLGDNFYQVGKIIEGIQSKLRGGIAVICLQKDANKSLGLGGGFSTHLASLYLSMDFNRMTVMKCKEWNGGHDPNNEVYGFNIIEGGTSFDYIRPVKKCPTCYGTGKSRGGECSVCSGKGWVNKNES